MACTSPRCRGSCSCEAAKPLVPFGTQAPEPCGCGTKESTARVRTPRARSSGLEAPAHPGAEGRTLLRPEGGQATLELPQVVRRSRPKRDVREVAPNREWPESAPGREQREPLAPPQVVEGVREEADGDALLALTRLPTAETVLPGVTAGERTEQPAGAAPDAPAAPLIVAGDVLAPPWNPPGEPSFGRHLGLDSEAPKRGKGGKGEGEEKGPKEPLDKSGSAAKPDDPDAPKPDAKPDAAPCACDCVCLPESKVFEVPDSSSAKGGGGSSGPGPGPGPGGTAAGPPGKQPAGTPRVGGAVWVTPRGPGFLGMLPVVDDGAGSDLASRGLSSVVDGDEAAMRPRPVIVDDGAGWGLPWVGASPGALTAPAASGSRRGRGLEDVDDGAGWGYPGPGAPPLAPASPAGTQSVVAPPQASGPAWEWTDLGEPAEWKEAPFTPPSFPPPDYPPAGGGGGKGQPAPEDVRRPDMGYVVGPPRRVERPALSPPLHPGGSTSGLERAPILPTGALPTAGGALVTRIRPRSGDPSRARVPFGGPRGGIDHSLAPAPEDLPWRAAGLRVGGAPRNRGEARPVVRAPQSQATRPLLDRSTFVADGTYAGPAPGQGTEDPFGLTSASQSGPTGFESLERKGGVSSQLAAKGLALTAPASDSNAERQPLGSPSAAATGTQAASGGRPAGPTAGEVTPPARSPLVPSGAPGWSRAAGALKAGGAVGAGVSPQRLVDASHWEGPGAAPAVALAPDGTGRAWTGGRSSGAGTAPQRGITQAQMPSGSQPGVGESAPRRGGGGGGIREAANKQFRANELDSAAARTQEQVASIKEGVGEALNRYSAAMGWAQAAEANKNSREADRHRGEAYVALEEARSAASQASQAQADADAQWTAAREAASEARAAENRALHGLNPASAEDARRRIDEEVARYQRPASQWQRQRDGLRQDQGAGRRQAAAEAERRAAPVSNSSDPRQRWNDALSRTAASTDEVAAGRAERLSALRALDAEQQGLAEAGAATSSDPYVRKRFNDLVQDSNRRGAESKSLSDAQRRDIKNALKEGDRLLRALEAEAKAHPGDLKLKKEIEDVKREMDKLKYLLGYSGPGSVLGGPVPNKPNEQGPDNRTRRPPGSLDGDGPQPQVNVTPLTPSQLPLSASVPCPPPCACPTLCPPGQVCRCPELRPGGTPRGGEGGGGGGGGAGGPSPTVSPPAQPPPPPPPPGHSDPTPPLSRPRYAESDESDTRGTQAGPGKKQAIEQIPCKDGRAVVQATWKGRGRIVSLGAGQFALWVGTYLYVFEELTPTQILDLELNLPLAEIEAIPYSIVGMKVRCLGDQRSRIHQWVEALLTWGGGDLARAFAESGIARAFGSSAFAKLVAKAILGEKVTAEDIADAVIEMLFAAALGLIVAGAGLVAVALGRRAGEAIRRLLGIAGARVTFNEVEAIVRRNLKRRLSEQALETYRKVLAQDMPKEMWAREAERVRVALAKGADEAAAGTETITSAPSRLPPPPVRPPGSQPTGPAPRSTALPRPPRDPVSPPGTHAGSQPPVRDPVRPPEAPVHAPEGTQGASSPQKSPQQPTTGGTPQAEPDPSAGQLIRKRTAPSGTAVPEIPRGFASAEEFKAFGDTLKRGLKDAGYPDARALFQGSSVTGRAYRAPHDPFDVGRTSDFDIALASESMLGRAASVGVELRTGGMRTGPLLPDQVKALGLENLQRTLEQAARGRPVKFMIYRDAESAAAHKPSIGVR
jgi:hypothetical protein